jgi:hypothetical protein
MQIQYINARPKYGFTNLLWVLFRIYAVRTYKNGDGYNALWNWWHPVSWVLVPILLILSFILYGVVENLDSLRNRPQDFGLGIADYFKKSPDKLVWVKYKRGA